jgi:MYXO-CTERM domain-containing protein
MTLVRRASALAVAFAVVFIAASASAQQDGPCGKFDFSSGSLSCKIEVEGGCNAQCTPLSFKAGCSGGCTATASQSCVDTCGTQCVAECNPQLLDCFAGCHAECDADVQAQCEAKGQQGVDCVEQAKAQCDMHCETSCEVPPSNCQEHCTSCCTGGCTTQVNFDCDFDCFAELKGGCEVQCSKPSGALFCNGQYVYASDIEACITYLAEQGINVDVSARGSASCDGDGCDLDGAIEGAGCAASQGSEPEAGGALALMLFGLVFAVRRRRRS